MHNDVELANDNQPRGSKTAPEMSQTVDVLAFERIPRHAERGVICRRGSRRTGGSVSSHAFASTLFRPFNHRHGAPSRLMPVVLNTNILPHHPLLILHTLSPTLSHTSRLLRGVISFASDRWPVAEPILTLLYSPHETSIPSQLRPCGCHFTCLAHALSSRPCSPALSAATHSTSPATASLAEACAHHSVTA